MAEKYAEQQQPAVCGKFAFGRYVAQCVSALVGLVTLTFDLLTLKLVCESHLRWEPYISHLGSLSLWVLELFAMYATNGQTDGRTDKSNAYCPLPYGRDIITLSDLKPRFYCNVISQCKIQITHGTRLKIEIYLQWPTDRKLYVVCRRRHFQRP